MKHRFIGFCLLLFGCVLGLGSLSYAESSLGVRVTDSASGELIAAEIILDGEALGEAPYLGMLPGGKRTLELRAAGYETQIMNLELLDNQATSVKLDWTLQEVTAPHASRMWWGLSSAAGAGAVAGLLFALRPSQADYDSAWSDYEKSLTSGSAGSQASLRDEAESIRPTQAWMTYSALGMAALAGGALVWGILEWQWSQSASVELIVTPMGVGAGGSF